MSEILSNCRLNVTDSGGLGGSVKIRHYYYIEVGLKLKQTAPTTMIYSVNKNNKTVYSNTKIKRKTIKINKYIYIIINIYIYIIL